MTDLELKRLARSARGTVVTRRGVVLGGLAGVGLSLSGCLGAKKVTRNIRVIAQAEVAGKTVEGTAVMGLRWKATGTGMYAESNAEAVVLELDGRGTVYILHSFMGSNRLVTSGLWPIIVSETLGIARTVNIKDFPLIEAAQGKYPIPVDSPVGRLNAPLLMVSFKDETKRETMFDVKVEDFPSVFGSDVRFKGLWFEFTDDAPTDTIMQRIPVIFNVNESYKDVFPDRGEDGNLISAVNKKFPQKIGKTAFRIRRF